jgi:seryl-tRNA synthetase
MHDIRAIREAPEAFDHSLRRLGYAPWTNETWSATILRIDHDRRLAIHMAETNVASKNRLSKQAGGAKKAGDEETFAAIRQGVEKLNTEIEAQRRLAQDLDKTLTDLLMTLPNLPDEDVPDGAGEADNVEIRRWGSPRAFAFEPLEHFEIPGAKPGFDFEAAGRLSGSRFVVLKGAMIRIHRALAQFMIDMHVERHDLVEHWTPVLVRDAAMLGTGQLPKFAEDSYQTTNGWWLIPTSEVTMTNLVSGQILEASGLPLRMTTHTQCFRSEAGSAGKDVAGILRQHQFEKVEMVSITTPQESRAEHERMTTCAQNVLEALALPYRTVVLCTGDMGFSARRTHDIEVWLPGQNAYREISSISVCGDFQARRMNARYRPEEGARPDFVHTLNGSGLAVGRCLIAVVENGQQEDGSIELPEALYPYLRGRSRVTAAGALV